MQQSGGYADADDQDPGRHRIERAGVADPTRAGQPSQPGHDIVRRPAGRLVDDYQPGLRHRPTLRAGGPVPRTVTPRV